MQTPCSLPSRRPYTFASIGERVATPNGFIAEIVSLREGRALLRYLSTQAGPEEIELPFGLLRPATARDLFLAGMK